MGKSEPTSVVAGHGVPEVAEEGSESVKLALSAGTNTSNGRLKPAGLDIRRSHLEQRGLDTRLAAVGGQKCGVAGCCGGPQVKRRSPYSVFSRSAQTRRAIAGDEPRYDSSGARSKGRADGQGERQ